MIQRSIRNRWSVSAREAILGVLLPGVCPACEESLGEHQAGICAHCWDEVIESDSPGPASGAIGSVTALGPYEGRLRTIIRCLKFGGLSGIGETLGERLARRWLARPRSIEAVIPVPLHWKRRWRRGYNQAERIASRLSRALGRPLLDQTLVRVRATRTQTGQSRRDRRRNVRGAFWVREPVPPSILLVDDVITTGATVRECARVLRTAGTRRLHVAVAARALVRTQQRTHTFDDEDQT